jgi:hypothetical protein
MTLTKNLKGIKTMSDKSKNQNDLFAGFTQEQALAILQKEKNKADNKDKKSELIKRASEEIVFIPASEHDDFFKDKPDIYALVLLDDENKDKPELLKPICKHKKSFKVLAGMAQGSKLGEAINAVLNPSLSPA